MAAGNRPTPDAISGAVTGTENVIVRSLNRTSPEVIQGAPDNGHYQIRGDGLLDYLFVYALPDQGISFQPGAAVSVGTRVRPSQHTGHIYTCTSAGVLPTEEPDWPQGLEGFSVGSAEFVAQLLPAPLVHGLVRAPGIYIEGRTKVQGSYTPVDVYVISAKTGQLIKYLESDRDGYFSLYSPHPCYITVLLADNPSFEPQTFGLLRA